MLILALVFTIVFLFRRCLETGMRWSPGSRPRVTGECSNPIPLR